MLTFATYFKAEKDIFEYIPYTCDLVFVKA